MTSATLPDVPRIRRSLRSVISGLAPVGNRLIRSALGVAKAKAAPVSSHLKEHAYSIFGFGFFDAACFTHSVFSGLMVTGISFLLFEWKVAE